MHYKDKTILYGESPDGETVRFYGQTGILLGEFKSAELAGVLRLGPWQKWAGRQVTNLDMRHKRTTPGTWERKCENWVQSINMRRGGDTRSQSIQTGKKNRMEANAAKRADWDAASLYMMKRMLCVARKSRRTTWEVWGETVENNARKRTEAKHARIKSDKKESIAAA